MRRSLFHFEVVLRPIEWALTNHSFDPGAGGSHKRRRGFVTRPHASLPLVSAQMNQLIRTWLPKVNGLMVEEIEAINAELPLADLRPFGG